MMFWRKSKKNDGTIDGWKIREGFRIVKRKEMAHDPYYIIQYETASHERVDDGVEGIVRKFDTEKEALSYCKWNYCEKTVDTVIVEF